MGPISYLIVEFPGSKMTGEGFAALLDLVDRGVIRIIDLMFVSRDLTVRCVHSTSRTSITTGSSISPFSPAPRRVCSIESDLSDAASVIEPGSSAGVLIFENRWATPFVQALRRGEAQLVSAGYIPQDDLVAALNVAET